MVGLCCSCCEVQKQTISSLCQRKSSPNSPQLCDARAKWEVVSLTGVLYLPAEWHRFHLPRCCFVYPPVSSAPECARCLAFHHTQRKERCDWNEAAQTLAYNWFQEPLLQCYSTPVVEPSLHRSLNIRSTSLWGHWRDFLEDLGLTASVTNGNRNIFFQQIYQAQISLFLILLTTLGSCIYFTIIYVINCR